MKKKVLRPTLNEQASEYTIGGLKPHKQAETSKPSKVLSARVSMDMARNNEPLFETPGIFDCSKRMDYGAEIHSQSDKFLDSPCQNLIKGLPEQGTGTSECIEAVSQSVGAEVEPKSIRRGSSQGHGKVSELPQKGSAGMTLKCSDTGRVTVVVQPRESLDNGEGSQELSRGSKLRDDKPAKECWIKVSEMQKRLAEKSEREPNHLFGNLYDLLTWEPLLEAAAERLLKNPGSRTPGLDGLTRDILKRNREYHLQILKQQLKSRTFTPTPVKRVYIPKKNRKKRPLGIPTLYDRWIQMAIKIIMEPIFESDFAEFSHGFRPERSCHTALSHIQRLTIPQRRKVYWVIEGDIEGFFDNVLHEKLINLLKKRIRDKKLLHLIWQFLKAGVMEGELFKKTVKGTPQGGVLSPLLANIYLNHFDQWFKEKALIGKHPGKRATRRAQGKANFMMVRYADDFVIFSNGTKKDTEAFKGEIKEWLGQELHLKLSEEKTVITHYTDGFDFLGFTIKKAKGWTNGGKETVISFPSTKSVNRAVQRVKELTRRNDIFRSSEDVIEALNAFLRGWGNYFRVACAKKALRYVGSRAFMRTWKWLVAKHKLGHGWREIKRRYYRENTWVVNGTKLFTLQSMKVEYPVYAKIGNPYLDKEPVEEPHHRDPLGYNSWKGQREYGEDWTPNKKKAIKTTEGKCALCRKSERIEVHHITARTKGGRNQLSNLIPLCRSCHRQSEKKNTQNSHILSKTLKQLSSGEPDEAKVSRPVRGEGRLKPTTEK
jgi:RNA-directed DNA polymerase